MPRNAPCRGCEVIVSGPDPQVQCPRPSCSKRSADLIRYLRLLPMFWIRGPEGLPDQPPLLMPGPTLPFPECLRNNRQTAAAELPGV